MTRSRPPHIILQIGQALFQVGSESGVEGSMAIYSVELTTRFFAVVHVLVHVFHGMS